MAVTPTITVENGGQLGTGNDKYAYGSITVTGTYVTGGFALDLPSSNFDMSSIRYLRATGSGRLLEWDVTNQKLLVKAWATAGATVAATEITNGTDIGATSDAYTFFAVGQ
jgi:hypothetical protein